MKLIKVGAAVLNQTPMAWETNRSNILGAIAEARAAGVSILCLPELAMSGYGCEDAFHAPMLAETAWQVLDEIAPATDGIAVAVGMPVLYQNALFNAACLVVDRKVVGFVAKQHLAGDGLHYEPRWFKAWPTGKRGKVLPPAGVCKNLRPPEAPRPGESACGYDIGDLYFDVGGVRIGFEICEDAWVANRPGGRLAELGVDLILNPSASHFAFGKIDVRKRFVVEGSRAFGVSYVYANLLGNESGRAIYDGGALIASAGTLLAAGPRFSYADYRVTTAIIDVAATRMNQARTASFQPQFDDNPRDCMPVAFRYPDIAPVLQSPTVPAWESGSHAKEEEFWRAEAIALYDYLRKSFSRGFVVSLSGGADSTTVSCLVALMVKAGVAELGTAGFIGKLGHIPGLHADMSETELVQRLLTCAYQGTANSGPVTREAARGVARGLNATYYEFEVGDLVDAYRTLVTKAIGRELDWQRDDVALQNIQARVRGPGVWMLANLAGALLLATSNRSEAAVGYATMDGDTCGGLSPIAGIDKPFVRRWLAWLEKSGPVEFGPMPFVSGVTVQAPTAELRPPSAAQTDEADLMPYDVLDTIERSTIRDKQSPVEALRLLILKFPGYTPQQLGQWVERFFTLWCRNQWKRERYAPSFHVDDENLDPRSWCRFPILSGGYQRELAELRDYVKSRS